MNQRSPKPVGTLVQLFRPFASFVRVESLGGRLLILASIAAMVWANSGASESYVALWEIPAFVGFAHWSIQEHLLFWVNDLLMVFFFLLVAMEIKRELVMGELNSPRKALLPLVAAGGGMLVPAAIYVAVAHGGEAAHGWGIPMATDIAFALGVLRILGSRIPKGLFAFLAALAIIDDLGAIVVIAIFYSSAISWGALGIAGLITLLLIGMNRVHIDRPGLYLVVGAPLWAVILQSGIHATIAGVIVGLCMPARGKAQTQALVADATGLAAVAEDPESSAVDVDGAVAALHSTAMKLESPLAALERTINPYVNFLIVPLFAFANAGVVLIGASPSLLLEPGALGVILGLVIGKPLGIVGATLLAMKTRLAHLPAGVTGRHLLGAGMLGGIGFTMSLFVAGLAFEPYSLLHIESKVGILTGSIISAIAGLLMLRGAPVTAALDPDAQLPNEGGAAASAGRESSA